MIAGIPSVNQIKNLLHKIKTIINAVKQEIEKLRSLIYPIKYSFSLSNNVPI